MSGERLTILKRKRAHQRSNITRFVTAIEGFTVETSLSDFRHNKDRLEETLSTVRVLDDEIHDLLSEEEFNTDIIACEEYIDKAKRALLIASDGIERKLAESMSTLNTNRVVPPADAVTTSVKLPTIKLEPFTGDIESWPRFWEQFESSVDSNPSLSTVNKHVFLRGYLEGEPKMLVDGIAVTASTYEDTKKILRERYGDINRIIQSHLDYLEAIVPVRFASPENLNLTFIECNRRIQALKSLGEDVNAYGRILVPKILRAFPEEICRRWIIRVKRHNFSEADVLKLMEFLAEEVDGALIAQKIRGEVQSNSNTLPSASALNIQSKQTRSKRNNKRKTEPHCVFCAQHGHWAQDCQTVLEVQDRLNRLKSSNRCFLCLKQGHTLKDCMKKGKAFCSSCKGNHHKSICDRKTPTSPKPQPSFSSVANVNTGHSGFTHLQTARVYVTGTTGEEKLIRCILDAGSQSTFVNRSLIASLNLQVINTQALRVDAFESTVTTSESRRLVRLNLRSIWNKGHHVINAFESSHTFSSHPSVKQDTTIMQHAHNLPLADPFDKHADVPIDLLIGADQYWQIVHDTSPIRISPSLVLMSSEFGWILSGSRPGVSAIHPAVNLINLEPQEPTDDKIRSFWDLESIGISSEQEPTMSARDSAILEEFNASYLIQDGRRVVRLPRKSTFVLPDNFRNAERRFTALEKRLLKNSELRNAYDTQMSEYIRQDHVELAPSEAHTDIFYLPHHIVKRERRGTIKWRVVFDGSAHEEGAPSLNDVLEVGPNLLPEVMSVLIRFRLRRFAIIADITQAFLQLALHSDDRDLTRFLWYKVSVNETLKPIQTREMTVYRFKRLPFGLTCCPFLLSATLRELATTYKSQFPTAADMIGDNMYMDDVAVGTEEQDGLVSLYYELISLMQQIQLPLSKWATNSPLLTEVWKAQGHDIQTNATVLGVLWDTKGDTFSLPQTAITDKRLEMIATKRNLLRVTASFYDPLGLVAPVSVTGKMLFQDTWLLGLKWDEILPHHLASKWHTWLSSLSDLSNIPIPRWISISETRNSRVHVFCDASDRIYGAVLYVTCEENGNTYTRLMCSKNRLAPVKRVTIPRLELLAALLGTRLLRYYCNATNCDVCSATLWTDSSIALAWIRSDPNTWKVFIYNRVTEIQRYTSPSQWRHCPGKDNPADYLSRGASPKTLQRLSVWWNGPTWLSQDASQWPDDRHEYVTLSSSMEYKKSRKPLQVSIVQIIKPVIDATRFSSYWKLLRATAWVLRFQRRLVNREIVQGEFTPEEMLAARTFWIKSVQTECFLPEITALMENQPLPNDSKIKNLNPYLHEGLLRLGGRLHFSQLTPEEQHPLILEGNHHFSKLLIMQTHIRLHHLGVRIVHLELRSLFWIVHARHTIKSVLHHCLPCKIAHSTASQAIEAPLPSDRVTPHKPFKVSGVDFAGPLFSKNGSFISKCYIVLFTCAITRAIHLELVTASTADKFLLAMERFVSRRGIPHTIYSDNAKTFQTANKELSELWATLTSDRMQQYNAQRNITWKFIAPRAAWWGGFWERMIGSVKQCLRKVLGKSSLDEERLRTVLISIEAALNSRPISQTDDEVLTPAHFLVGERLTALPRGTEAPKSTDIVKEFKYHQKLTEDIWNRWSKDYLLLLRSFHRVQNVSARQKIRIGDIVLLQEDRMPRNMWKRARVKDLVIGRDGVYRTVILTTPERREITRPIQLVIPLEIGQGGEDVTAHGS